jgi:tripartite-type tricarboxylate transporter receptor subunit TctC
VIALMAAAGGVSAQGYPSKPVRLVVPFAAGGGSDYVARVVGQKFLEAFGQPLIVDNRGGAGGAIGTEIAAKSPPDGYTLLLGSAGPLTIQPGLSARLPYDPIKDLAPVTLVSSIP